MAKAAAEAEATEKTKTPAIDTSDWNEANINIGGWYDPEKSGQLLGRCVEAIRVNTAFGEQDVVKVRVGRAIQAITGKGSEAQTVSLAVGDVIAVRVSFNLTTLLELVQNECAVEITPKGKQALKGGKAMWTYGLRWKGQRARLQQATATTEQRSPEPNDDDLPF